MIRRLLNAGFGKGPWRAAPLEAVVASRDHASLGIHRAEEPVGPLAVVPGEVVSYQDGESLLQQTWQFEPLREGSRYRKELTTSLPPRRLHVLSDAGVIGADAVVYCTRNRTAVEETLRQWHGRPAAHRVLGAMGYPAATRLKGVTLSIGTLAGEGFYHFLLESLPRLNLAGNWLARVDHVIANGTPGSFQEAWLRDAGLPAAKIRWLEGLAHYTCDTLLFTDPPMPDQRPGPWNVSALRELFPSPPAPTDRKLWISRRDATVRPFTWEERLLSQLPELERIELARLSPAAQRATLAGAKVIVAPHGAGLGHLVFTQCGPRVVEIFPERRWMQPIYGRLASLVDAPYAWARVDCDQPDRAEELALAIRRFARL